MPYFVALYKLTDQGMKDIKNAPELIEEGIKTAEEAGISVKTFLMTFGEYDFIAISDVPDPMSGAAVTLTLAAQGNVRSTTMQAFTVDEFKEVVSHLP